MQHLWVKYAFGFFYTWIFVNDGLPLTIMGDSCHFCQMLLIKYAARIITNAKDIPKKTLSKADSTLDPQYLSPWRDEFRQYSLRFSQALVDANLSLFETTTRGMILYFMGVIQQLNPNAYGTEMKRAFLFLHNNARKIMKIALGKIMFA